MNSECGARSAKWVRSSRKGAKTRRGDWAAGIRVKKIEVKKTLLNVFDPHLFDQENLGRKISAMFLRICRSN